MRFSVNRELLRAAIYADIDHDITGSIPSARTKIDLTDSVMGTIEPFLAKTKPVSVSLEKCVAALDDVACEKWNGDIDYEPHTFCRAVLDAAGVAYVD